MQQNPRETIIKLLDLIGYSGDKEKCADELLILCLQEMVIDLAPNLAKDNQNVLNQKLTDGNQDKVLEIIREVVGYRELAQSLEKATQKVFRGYFQTINSTLSDDQRNNLKSYFQSLSAIS